MNNEKKSTDYKTALFFNHIKGFEKDLAFIQEMLKDLGWKCIDLDVNSINDFQIQFQNN